MKKLLVIVLGLSLFSTQAFAFRDISQNSALHNMVENLVQRGLFEDKGFFRADEAVPAKFFWEVLIRDTGFNPVSATFDTPLPSNIAEDNELVPFLREAIRRGFIDSGQKFIEFKSMKRIEVIKLLVKTKGILPPKVLSSKFQKIVSGTPKKAQYLNEVEAALASQMLENKDVSPLKPYDEISRRDFIRWIYNWHENGELKNSELEVPEYKKTNTTQQYPYQKRSSTTTDTNENTTTKKKTPTIRIEEILNGAFSSSSNNLDLQVLNEVYRQIENKFKFTEKLDEAGKQKIINAGITAMVKGLEDKYSTYVEPKKSEAFIESIEGNFEGIGAYVEMVHDQFTITSPIIGSPAETAGIKAGDIVKKVDGVDITGMGTAEIIEKIKGKSGTKVTLDLIRVGRGLSITVARGKINIPSLTLKWQNSVPIIGMHQFSRDTGSKLQEMIKNEVLPKNPRGIVFDLRNNPGGFLTSAVSVGEVFLKKGAKIFNVEYKTGEQEYTASRTGELANFKKPMVFLQNKGSASASEILTAMIQDYGIGKIMGMPSLGKGTVQEIVSFSNGGNLKITIAKWISPKGRWINGKGVFPDEQVDDASEIQRKNEVDPQLDAAIQSVIRNK